MNVTSSPRSNDSPIRDLYFSVSRTRCILLPPCSQNTHAHLPRVVVHTALGGEKWAIRNVKISRLTVLAAEVQVIY